MYNFILVIKRNIFLFVLKVSFFLKLIINVNMYDTEVHGHLHISLNRYFNRFGNVVAMIITIVKIT
jgi:hypothetical protein